MKSGVASLKKGVLRGCGALLLASAFAAQGGDGSQGADAKEAERFPFVIPLNETSKTFVDVSALNPAPLTAGSRISIGDGHFRDAAGRRVRFMGVSMCAGVCFPPKEDAPAIAARLHKYGINCVRLHHMDPPWAKPGIFHFSGSSGKTTDKLDPESLDRLDALLAEFKKNGIYVDLNLHVTRPWTKEDGFPDADKIHREGKIVAYFEPHAIELQREYARQLLTHVNPYTNLSYAEDPVVAVIELNNEDSLIGSAASIHTLPPHYLDILAKSWNEFLKKKYGTTEKLVAAWGANAQPLGDEMLKNGDFKAGTEGWLLEHQGSSSAELNAEDPAGATNAPSGRILRAGKLKPDGTNWHLQLHQVGLNLKEGQLYTLSFVARANSTRPIGVNVRMDKAPWTMAGLDSSAVLTGDWRQYSYSFVAGSVQPDHTRISFVLGDKNADIFLGEVSLKPGGGGVKLGKDESLENDGISLPFMSNSRAGVDFVEYLMKVEGDYSQGLREFIRKDLKCPAPVICSQASYGGLAGVQREARLDWIDMHAYWQHPSFPRRSWDSNDYRIDNTSMTRASGVGALYGLAVHRVEGKPFTVTEYDHPAPNEYSAEGVPMIFSFAARQDWDGVFLFAYDGKKPDHIGGFFDQAAHPAKIGFLPAAARIFLAGEVAPSPLKQILVVPQSQIPLLTAGRPGYGFWNACSQSGQTSNPMDMLERETMVRISPDADKVGIILEGQPAPDPVKVEWRKGADALYSVDAPAAKIAVGFLGGKGVSLSGMTVEVAPSKRNFASIALVSVDGKPVEESNALLLTAVDKVENPGLQWNAERNFAKDSWKSGPTLAEVPSLKVALKTSAKEAHVHALDSTGARASAVESELKDGLLTFSTSPAQKAIWYEIEARR